MYVCVLQPLSAHNALLGLCWMMFLGAAGSVPDFWFTVLADNYITHMLSAEHPLCTSTYVLLVACCEMCVCLPGPGSSDCGSPESRRPCVGPLRCAVSPGISVWHSL